MTPSSATATTHDETEARTREGRRLRPVALRGIYGVLTLWGLAMAQAVLWVITDTLPTADAAWAAGVSTGWKLLVFGPALVLCVTAGRSVVAAQLLGLGVLGFAVLEIALLPTAADRPPALLAAPLVLLQLLIWLGPWLLLSPLRRQIVRVHPRPHLPIVLLALAAATVELAWAVQQWGRPLLPVERDFALDARASVTDLAVLLALLTVFSALRPRGRTWPGLAVAAAAAWIGTWSVALPDAWASPGRAWGAALLTWAVAYGLLLLGQREHR